MPIRLTAFAACLMQEFRRAGFWRRLSIVNRLRRGTSALVPCLHWLRAISGIIGMSVKSGGVMHRAATFIDKIFCNLYGFTLYYPYLLIKASSTGAVYIYNICSAKKVRREDAEGNYACSRKINETLDGGQILECG